MTVSSSTNRELTLGKIFRRAFQLAGLYEVTQSIRSADMDLAKDFAETIIDGLSALGPSARHRTFEEVTLTSGTYIYSLDATTLDVLGDGMYIAASEADTSKADSETVIVQRNMETWHTVSGKSATGTPAMFFTDRSGTTIKVRLWPIPDEAGTVRFQVHRHLADCDDTEATLDLQTYWVEYIMYELAARLAEAKSIPGSKVDRLQATAARKLVTAKGFASEHTATYIYMDHGA